MESDFSIRKEVDGIDGGDPSLRELLNNYKFPPKNQSQSTAGFGGIPAGGSSNDLYLGNMIGQLQGAVERLGQEKRRERSSTFGGLQLSIDPEVLRWLIVLAVILVLVWIFLVKAESAKRKRKNPLKRRLKKLEKQVNYLSSSKKSLPKLDDLEDDDDDDDF